MSDPEHVSKIIPRVMAQFRFSIGDIVVNDGRVGEVVRQATSRIDGSKWNLVRFMRPDTPDEWIVDSELTRGRKRK